MTDPLPPCTCRSWSPDNPCPRHTLLAEQQRQRDEERAREYTPENREENGYE